MAFSSDASSQSPSSVGVIRVCFGEAATMALAAAVISVPMIVPAPVQAAMVAAQSDSAASQGDLIDAISES